MGKNIEQSQWQALTEQHPEKVFSEIYQESSRPVWTLCYRILKSEEDASDAFQGAYARLIQLANQESQPPHCHSFLTLMLRLAGLEADRLRKKRQRRQDREVTTEMIDPPDEKTPLHDQLSQQQLTEKLTEIIDELPDRLRIPVILYYLDGMPQNQIATAMGVSHSTINKRLKRALEELRPKCRRAGLKELTTVLAAVAGIQTLLSPPAALAENIVLQGALQASQGAGLGSISLSSLEPVKGTALVGGKALLMIVASFIAVISITTLALIGPYSAKNSSSTGNQSLAEQRGPVSITDNDDQSLNMQGWSGGLDGNGSQEEEGEEIIPPGYARVSFQALWEDTQEPVENATLAVNRLEEEKTTDGRGRVSILVDLTKGEEREVTFSHPETITWRETVNVTGEEVQTVYLKEAAFIKGTLLYEDDGRIAAGKPVVVTTLSEKVDPLFDVKEVVTNENGRYMAKLNEENRYLITVNDGEYIGRTKEGERLVINAKGGEITEAPDLYIQKGGGIYGTITDKTGKPLENIKVKLEDSGFETKLSESDGYYEFTPVIPGAYTLQVQEVNNYLTEYKRITIGEGENKEVNIALEECGQIQFEVIDDETGEPIPVYTVKRIWNHMHLPLFPVEDHGNGKITFSGLSLSQGNYIYLSASGYMTHTDNYTVPSDGYTDPFIIRLKKPEKKKVAVKGNVYTEMGSPIEGVTISNTFGYTPSMSAVTDADGAYLLVLSDRALISKLWASKPGYAVSCIEFANVGEVSSPEVHDFTLSPGNWLELTIKDEAGNPIENVAVSFHQTVQYNTAVVPPRCYQKTTPEADGATHRFEDLPDNIEKVDVSSKGYSNFQEKIELNNHHQIVLKAMGVILGEVVDSETGKPIENFNIKIHGGGGIDMRRATFGESFSDPDGLFLLKDLNQGKDYTITINAEGYKENVLFKITSLGPNDDTIITIEMEKNKFQAIQIVDDQTSKPVVDISVGTIIYADLGTILTDWDSLASENPVYRSDQNGIVHIPNPEQFTNLILFPHQHYARQIIRLRSMEPKNGELVVRLKPGSTINGRFTRISPDYVTINHTELRDIGISIKRNKTKLGDLGSFTIPNLAPGQYRISPFILSGHTSTQYFMKTITVNEYGETINVTLDENLGSTKLSGTLTLDDEPMKFESISIQAKFPSNNIKWFSSVTKHNGTYEFPHLENGEYQLMVNFSRSRQQPTLYRQVVVSGDTVYNFKAYSGHEITLDFSLPGSLLDDGYKVQYVYVARISGVPDTLYFRKDADIWQTKGDVNGVFEFTVSLSNDKEQKSLRLPGEFIINTSDGPIDLGVIDVPEE